MLSSLANQLRLPHLIPLEIPTFNNPIIVSFKLDSNFIFLRCADNVNIDAFELNPSASPSLVKASDWKLLVTIGPNLHHDALEIFGVVINGLDFKNLAQELCSFRFIVNREGYCYLNSSPVVDPSFGLAYFRLNDLFGWSKYGVKPNSTWIWNRCDILQGGALINLEDQYSILTRLEEDIKKKEEELELSKEDIAALQIELDKWHNRVPTNRTGGSAPPPPPPPPPVRFYVSPSLLPTQFDVTWILRMFKVVDEDVTGLFPRNVSVYVRDGQFDTENWRFVRAQENNLTYLVAFYGGGFGQVEVHGNIVNVPYNGGVSLLADVYFFVAQISGIGYRFAFLY